MKNKKSDQSFGSYNSNDPDRPRWNLETKRERRHEYRNEDKSHAYFFDKGLNPDGGKPFRCRHRNTLSYGDRIEPEQKADELPGKPANQPWVLYRLPELIATPKDQVVFICEGEKDADTLAGIGLAATTSPNGAEKWLDQFSEYLKERKVVIIPDNDLRGYRHLRKVLKSVHPLAASVQVVEMPENVKDVTDWIEAGGTREKLEALVAEAKPADPDNWLGKDAIILTPGKSPEIIDKISEQLRLAGVQIYQRAGELVRPVTVGKPKGNGQQPVKRDEKALIIKPVTSHWLTDQAERHISFRRPRMRKQESEDGSVKKLVGYAPVDLPMIHAEKFLKREGQWKEPVLRGVGSAPMLRADGSGIEKPGYDPETEMLLQFDPDTFPAIPVKPTKKQAQEGLMEFERLLAGFPFVDDAARAVALSGMLTAVIRPSLATAPMHAFDAPMAGTGKSKLATMAGVLATGHVPAAMSQGKSEEEDEKRLSTVLMEGDPVIVLDNCERAVGGDFLCSMITEPTVQARILGKSERRILPNLAMVFATGNNLAISGDMTRRTVIGRLDAKDERPDLREFDFDPVQEVITHRPALLVAALTALRAYKLAKPVKLSAMGSFEDWAWVRGTLVWLGYADPASTREILFDADPRRTEVMEVMEVWNEVIGPKTVTVAEIGASIHGQPLHKLQLALVSVTGGHGWNARSVGRWLVRNKDKVLGGMALRVLQTGRHGAAYRLEGAKTEPM